MKKIIIGVAILMIIGVAAFFVISNKGSVPQFRTEKIAKGDLTTVVTATGTVNAVTTVLVGTQVSGTIKTLYADFNSHVKKGQIIAQIDPALFQAQVEQARANLVTSKANLAKSEVSVVDTKRTLERNRELFAKNLIARSDMDTAETNYDSAVAQVKANKAQVEQAAAALRTAETNLAYTRILSPVDGVVVSRNVDVGQTVAASFQTPTLFTIAQDLTKMQIDSSVAEADVGKIELGQEVNFTVDAYPDTTFKGKVWQIRIAPITVQNVVTYDVVILIDNQQMRLMPGMTANVSVIVDEKKDVIKIPNAALRFRPADRTRVGTTGSTKGGQGGKAKGGSVERGPAVWIIDNGKPKRISIKTGISDGSYTELVSDELKEGQEVIVESISKMKQEPTRAPRMF
ncbi:MAG TPA: efflux RND transporter periplasmic adaptor subunit [Candidatus Sulfobium mesophilum]|jgi:HlyD family secretion protein|nr:efflux RND transporter periplasmic adaptor subunit [Candidatus Sulfobium mesophilum]